MNPWDETLCPICATKCVPPFGPTKSPILIVAEFPGEEEIKEGVPMVGPMGRVLKAELSYLGLDLQSVRRMNLWQHAPNKNKDCLTEGSKIVLDEAIGKKAILLLGSDAVKQFTPYGVMDICGIPIQSDYFSAQLIIASPNPAQVFHKSAGEVRLALKKFVQHCEEQGIL